MHPLLQDKHTHIHMEECFDAIALLMCLLSIQAELICLELWKWGEFYSELSTRSLNDHYNTQTL